jgi:hypothetical protein
MLALDVDIAGQAAEAELAQKRPKQARCRYGHADNDEGAFHSRSIFTIHGNRLQRQRYI